MYNELDLLDILGYYVYIETSAPRHAGDKAVLSTGILQPAANGVCLTFWYHMFGAHVETLNVYSETTGGNRTMIWSNSKTQGNVWKQATRTITSLYPYKVSHF